MKEARDALKLQHSTFTFTFREFSRHFCPKWLTISTFVTRKKPQHITIDEVKKKMYSTVTKYNVFFSQHNYEYKLLFDSWCLSEKLRSISSCQTQIQVMDIIHSSEMILKYRKALPTGYIKVQELNDEWMKNVKSIEALLSWGQEKAG